MAEKRPVPDIQGNHSPKAVPQTGMMGRLETDKQKDLRLTQPSVETG